MRREKEIAESRFEVAQGETLRYRLRVEHLERELKEVQDSLSAERDRMQVCFHTGSLSNFTVIMVRLLLYRAHRLVLLVCFTGGEWVGVSQYHLILVIVVLGTLCLEVDLFHDHIPKGNRGRQTDRDQ